MGLWKFRLQIMPPVEQKSRLPSRCVIDVFEMNAYLGQRNATLDSRIFEVQPFASCLPPNRSNTIHLRKTLWNAVNWLSASPSWETGFTTWIYTAYRPRPIIFWAIFPALNGGRLPARFPRT